MFDKHVRLNCDFDFQDITKSFIRGILTHEAGSFFVFTVVNERADPLFR